MKTIRWGIIGCGDVTEIKSGPALQKAQNSALVAVMRRNGALAQDYAQRHGVPKWYDDGAALINDPDVDAVYVATPPNAHHEYTLMAAAAGKPIYVEKPMAMNMAQCTEMLAACNEAQVPLWVAYYRRKLPRFTKIKALLDEGAIGTVHAVNIQLLRQAMPQEQDAENRPWRLQPEIGGGGLFMDLAVHTLDFLDHALGPIQSVQGCAANQAGHYEAEDIVSASFVFESGVQATGLWCFNSFTYLDSTEIIGDKGKITFSTLGTEPVQLTTADGLTEFDAATPAHIQQPLVQSIVDELNGLGSCPSSGTSGARTNWVAEQIFSGS